MANLPCKMLTPRVLLTLLLVMSVPAAGRGAGQESGEREDAGISRRQADDPEVERDGVDGIVLPLVGYNSDEKLGVGITGGMYIYEPGYAPFQHALAAQAWFTTAGIRSHFFRYDGPNFLGTGLRLETRLEFRREMFAPYYGPGNESAPGYGGEERSTRYSYDRTGWGGWARVRLPRNDGSGAEPYIGYGFRQNRIGLEPPAHLRGSGSEGRVYDGPSLLAEQRPIGIEGGRTGHLLLGIIWDTRNEETAPTHGGSVEFSMRLAAPPTGSRYTYAQLTATARTFVPLHRRIVFAQRLIGDVLVGDVPFFEWHTFGGINPAEGIGGQSSVRGLQKMRYTGTSKFVSNSELRFTFFEPVIFGQETAFGAVAFFDFGRAWFPRIDDGPWYKVHPGGGVGLRVVRRAAAVRLDYGVSAEQSGLYLMFGHMF